MNKNEAIAQIYQITTLTNPSDEVLQLLSEVDFKRFLDLMMVLRQYKGNISAPHRFLKRAIDENWTAETLPERVDRKKENHEQRFYVKRGLSEDQAQQKVIAQRNMQAWERGSKND